MSNQQENKQENKIKTAIELTAIKNQVELFDKDNKSFIKDVYDSYEKDIIELRNKIWELESQKSKLGRECEEKMATIESKTKEQWDNYKKEVRKTSIVLYLLILQDQGKLRLTIRDQIDRISSEELLESHTVNKYRQEIKLIMDRIYVNDFVEMTPVVITKSSMRGGSYKDLELNVYIKGFIKTPRLIYNEYKENIKFSAGYDEKCRIWLYIPVTTMASSKHIEQDANSKYKMIFNKTKEFIADIENFFNTYIPLMEQFSLSENISLLENKEVIYNLDNFGLNHHVQRELREKYGLRKEIEY